jgi:hypothetical protein
VSYDPRPCFSKCSLRRGKLCLASLLVKVRFSCSGCPVRHCFQEGCGQATCVQRTAA